MLNEVSIASCWSGLPRIPAVYPSPPTIASTNEDYFRTLLRQSARGSGPGLNVRPRPQAGAAPHAKGLGKVGVAEGEVARALRVGEAEALGDHPYVDQVIDIDIAPHGVAS